MGTSRHPSFNKLFYTGQEPREKTTDGYTIHNYMLIWIEWAILMLLLVLLLGGIVMFYIVYALKIEVDSELQGVVKNRAVACQQLIDLHEEAPSVCSDKRVARFLKTP